MHNISTRQFCFGDFQLDFNSSNRSTDPDSEDMTLANVFCNMLPDDL